MARIPFQDLDEAIDNPQGYRQRMLANESQWYPPYSYFKSLVGAIYSFHRSNDDNNMGLDYLEEKLERLKNEQRCIDTIDQYRWYLEEYNSRGWHSFRTRLDIGISLPPWMPPDFRCSGRLGRLDLIPTEGYAIWLFRPRGYERWENELCMPLIQKEVSETVLGVHISKVRIGIYSFEERFVDDRSYSESEIITSEEKFIKLLSDLGYPIIKFSIN